MTFTFWLTYAFVVIKNEITIQEYISLIKKKAGVKA